MTVKLPAGVAVSGTPAACAYVPCCSTGNAQRWELEVSWDNCKDVLQAVAQKGCPHATVEVRLPGSERELAQLEAPVVVVLSKALARDDRGVSTHQRQGLAEADIWAHSVSDARLLRVLQRVDSLRLHVRFALAGLAHNWTVEPWWAFGTRVLQTSAV